MPDPVNQQLTRLDVLEGQLEKFIARPKGTAGDPDSFKSNTADATATLTTVGDLLKITYGITPDIRLVGGEISTAISTAAAALREVGDKLKDFKAPAGVAPAEVVQLLQVALATAQSLLSGGSPAPASGSRFFEQLAELLSSVGNDVNRARTILYQLAQQLAAIAGALQPV